MSGLQMRPTRRSLNGTGNEGDPVTESKWTTRITAVSDRMIS